MESAINPNRKIGVEVEVVVPIIGRGDNRDVQDFLADQATKRGRLRFLAAARLLRRSPVMPKPIHGAVDQG